MAALMGPASEASGRARKKLSGVDGLIGLFPYVSKTQPKALRVMKFMSTSFHLTPLNDISGISDLERALARLQASTVSGAVGREAGNVVLYEDMGKRRVKALVSAIRDLQV